MSISSQPSNVVNQLPISLEMPLDEAQRQEILSLSLKRYAQVINTKTGGLYTNYEQYNFEQFFTPGNPQVFRNIYRKAFTFGAIASGTELDIPTGITGVTLFTRIYGTVVTANGFMGNPDYRPIPYIDPNALNVGMTILVGIVGGIQQIRIVLGTGAPAVTSGLAILEFMHN